MLTDNMLKEVIKKCVPQELHSFIRKRTIMAKHRKVASMLAGLVEDCIAGRYTRFKGFKAYRQKKFKY